MKNWKTTLLGILAVATAVVQNFFPQYAVHWNTVIGLLAGFGLVAAKDAGKSGQ